MKTLCALGLRIAATILASASAVLGAAWTLVVIVMICVGLAGAVLAVLPLLVAILLRDAANWLLSKNHANHRAAQTVLPEVAVHVPMPSVKPPRPTPPRPWPINMTVTRGGSADDTDGDVWR